jgi:nitrate/TMAO reductase-like tetraheme cytochrome c subunit
VSPLRAVAGLLVLGAAAWLLYAIFATPEAIAEARTFTSSRQCQECHAQVFAEWEESWHAQAWTDPEVRALSNDFANTDCIDCHAPRPVFETGIGQRVLPRAARREEGVDCIACHVLPDGRIAGTIEDPSAACRPTERRELVAPEFCAPCHDQHGTVQQWRASRFAEPGPGFKDCVACHMPPRDGDPRKGSDHRMHGGHDLELVRSAVELRGAREGGRWVVEVENVGAGHNFPTDERSRAADLFWRPIAGGAEGAAPAAWRHLYRFRSPYRYEVGIEDTELPAGETVRVPIDGEEAAGAVEVALFYKLSPYWKDPEHPDPEREAALVHRLRLEP